MMAERKAAEVLLNAIVLHIKVCVITYLCLCLVCEIFCLSEQQMPLEGASQVNKPCINVYDCFT